MKIYLTKLPEKIKKEVNDHRLLYSGLFAVILITFFIRVYRTFDLLGFYYDQGRDALVIWNFWHNGKPFLIGPITGLKGIYLGPFFYYLIAPFYLIGKGNPVYPAVFLAFLSTAAIFILYIVAARMHSRIAGIIAVTISAFSYSIFTASRWLSNPTPILFTSIIFLWSLWEISSKRKQLKVKRHTLGYWWVVASFMTGLSLQFESASAVFYIPIFIVFTVWQRKKIPDLKFIFLAFFALAATFIPQFIFDVRHEHLLLNNFKNLLFEEKAFRGGMTEFIFAERSKLIWRVFASKIFTGIGIYPTIFYSVSLSMLLLLPSRIKAKLLTLFAIFLLIPIISYYLFRGNYGNVYDYYLTGYYLPIVLLFSIGMAELVKRRLGYIVVIVFFFLSFKDNLAVIRNYLTADYKTRPISLSDETAAVDWIFENAMANKFNVAIYVPPVIPHAYNYLFLWRGTLRCGPTLCGKTDENTNPFYILYEPENVHMDRFSEWIENINNTSSAQETVKFGQITVEKRLKK